MSGPQTAAGRALVALMAEADIRWPDEHTRVAASVIEQQIIRIEAASPLDTARLAKVLVRPYGSNPGLGQCRVCGEDGATVGRLYEPEAISDEYADLAEP